MSTGETTGKNTGNLHAGQSRVEFRAQPGDDLHYELEVRMQITIRTNLFFYAWLLCMGRVSPYISCASYKRGGGGCAHDFSRRASVWFENIPCLIWPSGFQ